MAEQSQQPTTQADQQRQEAIKAYHDAKTKAEKAEVVKRYPVLREIFTEVNHS